MNFSKNYHLYHALQFNQETFTKDRIRNIFFGSGGSHSLILEIEPPKQKIKISRGSTQGVESIIVKIMPILAYPEIATILDILPNKNEVESHIAVLLTKRLVLGSVTPHIVGTYNYQKCDRFGDLLDLLLDGVHCPSKEQVLMHSDAIYDRIVKKKQKSKKIITSHMIEIICHLRKEFNIELIKPTYHAIMMEYIPHRLGDILDGHFEDISEIKSTKNFAEQISRSLSNILHDLHRIVFQIIYTLSVIKKHYPHFVHNDFFLRNIMATIETTYDKNDYVIYEYDGKKFYLPANGIYVKITDFGYTILEKNQKTHPALVNRMKYFNLLDEKSDLFNFFHDLYDGESIWSMKALQKKYKLDTQIMAPIYKYLNNFVNLKTIDTINKKNRAYFDETWKIYGIPLLEKAILTPHQYLSDDKYFLDLQKKPPEMHVVQLFKSYK